MHKVSNFYEGRTVLVTGAAGFIGSTLARRLSDLGADVRGTPHAILLQQKAEGKAVTRTPLARPACSTRHETFLSFVS